MLRYEFDTKIEKSLIFIKLMAVFLKELLRIASSNPKQEMHMEYLTALYLVIALVHQNKVPAFEGDRGDIGLFSPSLPACLLLKRKPCSMDN